MSEPKDYTPKPYTCGTCVHFKPKIIYSHRGVPYAMWYGLCAILPLTRCETAHTCPCWAENSRPRSCVLG